MNKPKVMPLNFKKAEPLILLAATTIAVVVSGIRPYDRITWLLEVMPIFVGAPLLITTYKKLPFTALLYRLLFVHSLILVIGGHYTYARVPLGFWVQDLLHLGRNHYDRIGHFAQGFIPAILAREILIRRSPLVHGKWLFFLIVSVCLAFSAFYELIEWWAAVAGGEAAESFLGTQGDVWDTQWDMFIALLGAIPFFNCIRRLDSPQLSYWQIRYGSGIVCGIFFRFRLPLPHLSRQKCAALGLWICACFNCCRPVFNH